MKTGLALCAAAALIPGLAWAQTVSAGGSFERYSFNDPAALDIESLSLFSAPFGVTLTRGRFVLALSGAAARASLVAPGGSETTVSGLTDTQLSARVDVAGGRAVLTGIALLPTGNESLTFDETFVAGAIAADVLPFATRSWGTGGGAGAGLALAQPFGAFAAGLSIGYVMAREYQPLAGDAFTYRPGNQLHVRAAVDRTIGRTAKLSVRADWRTYGADEGDGRNVFQTGDRLQVVGSYDFAVGRSSAIAYAGWLKRLEGEYVPPPDILVSQELVYAGAGSRTPLGRAVLVPSIELRVLDARGSDRHGYTAGVGASIELPVGSTIVVPDARFRFGRAYATDGAGTGLTGVELGVAMRFGSLVR